MVSKGLIKIPDESLVEFNGSQFIIKRDLSKLEEFGSFLFLKKSRYLTLFDYPYMGTSEDRLQYSKIYGPFREESEIESMLWSEDYQFQNIKEKILEVPVPINFSASDFQEIAYLRFATAYDINSRNYLSLFQDREKSINFGEILKIVNQTLKNLQNYGVNSESDISYKLNTKDYALEFLLGKDLPYPSLDLRIFGKKDICLNLIDTIGIRDIRQQFPIHLVNIGIHDIKSEGFAYNLSLENKSITNLLTSDNSIL